MSAQIGVVALGEPTSWGLSAPSGAWVDARDAQAWCIDGVSSDRSFGYARCR